MNNTFGKVIKAAIGLLVVFILLGLVNRWWGEFRSESANGSGSTTATSTAPPQGEGEKPSDSTKSAKRLVVLTDGLNFRERPSRGGNAIRELDKGETLILIKKEGDWYNVEDSKGVKGWISADSTYTKAKK